MTIAVQSHGEFQRAALLLIAAGGGLALLAGAGALGVLTGGVPVVLPVVLAGLGFTRVARQLEARVHQRSRFGPWLFALTALAAALGAALAAWPALVAALAPMAAGSALAMLGWPVAGGLFGLISSVGLLGAHLVIMDGDQLEARLFAGRTALQPEERALAERAVVAHRRLATGLGGEASPDARRLRHTARAMTLEVLALAARSSDLAVELRAVDRAVLARRVAELARAGEATGDEAARADFMRASSSAAALQRHLGDLDAAADRVRARLALQVGALESTALALATRRASKVADQALALAPLVERLDEAGAELHAEASALAELGAGGR
jgi:transcriptional regulator with XRE-family HTH domain/uncharacterized membrane protein YbaN (DUF454 family)